METITIEPATLARWSDLQQALNGGGGRTCQCAWWMLTNAQYPDTTVDDRREILRDEVTAGPPPGLIAYVDGDPAGWVRITPRPKQARLARTRNIARATTEPLDDPSVWALSCFIVRREHRGKGLMSALLRAAVGHARDSGARVVEGYPIDTSVGAHRAPDMFVGTLSSFLAAGFTETAERKPGQPIVTLTLG